MIVALEPNVVALIKDLNGNHVIQKCLHKLSPEHNQFIYDTVSQHCIEVASHKHGCCVYQRCIDHAVQSQKVKLNFYYFYYLANIYILFLIIDSTCKCNYSKCIAFSSRSFWQLCCTICIGIG